MIPVFRSTDIEVDNIDEFTTSLNSINDPTHLYSVIESKKYSVPADSE